MSTVAPFDLRGFYRFCNTLKIDTKEKGEIYLGKSFMGTQTYVVNEMAAGMENGVRNFVTLKCCAPDTRVLCADLRWRAIADLAVGDQIVAFDEHRIDSQERDMRTATVKSSWWSKKPALTIVTDTCRVTVSRDHPLLVRTRGGSTLVWKPASWLQPGDSIRKIVDPWNGDPSFEDGWIGGIIDGEGHLRMNSVSGVGVSISQVAGSVLDRVRRYLEYGGYHYNEVIDERDPGTTSKLGSKPVHRLTVHRMQEVFRLLGTTRPVRFLSGWWEGRGLPGKKIAGLAYSTIEEIIDVGERDLVDIETTTGTFIGEGLCHHNCRQIGVSTISLAIDLYWVFKHRALSGALVTHDEPARDQFRTTLDMYYDGLPDNWKQRRLQNNRNGMIFANKSRLMFRVAGARKTGGGSLGRSAALPFLHATEISSWGDPEGLKSLKASLAETNPHRLYHWESTARGFNHFYDMWEEAKRAVTQKAIFVSFWANEFYRAPRHSDIWKAYWGFKGRPTPDEREWIREVKALYKVEIDDCQMAWWRWKIAEDMGDELMMMQEFPPTENHAFIATGSQFFTAASISDGYKRERSYDRPRYFRVQIGTHFSDTVLLATPEKLATLRVWEEPKAKGTYVMGADPAYGSSEWADRFCLSVWRCYADRIVQVAEFVDPDMATYSFAWVLAYLAGAYSPCRVNLEINGPGQSVLAELQNMKRAMVAVGGTNRDPNVARDANTLMHVTRNITNYLYRRLDTMSGSAMGIHTLMGHDFKERMMNTFRDYYERGMITVKSRGLLDEMKSIVREGGAAPAAPDRSKDDRVIAAALATLTWNDQERTRLLTINATEELVTKAEATGPAGVVDKMVANYLQKIGIKQQPGQRR